LHNDVDYRERNVLRSDTVSMWVCAVVAEVVASFVCLVIKDDALGVFSQWKDFCVRVARDVLAQCDL